MPKILYIANEAILVFYDKDVLVIDDPNHSEDGKRLFLNNDDIYITDGYSKNLVMG